MKVLLINPFLTVYQDDPSGVNPPLGLAYLASFLEKNNIEVKLVDIAAEGLNNKKIIGKKIRIGLNEEEIKKRILDYSPDVVGITCQSTLHAKDALETAKIVKETNPKIIIVIGGAHPSADFEELLKDKNIDIVVRGEGEITFWKIVEAIKKKSSYKNIAGTSLKIGNRIINNPPREYIKDLDRLPFPARHLLPIDTYFQVAKQNINYSKGNRVATMITSRGCPGSCIYCSVRTVWGRQWRGRSPKNVVDEIETLINDYKINEVHFLDDSISVNKKRMEGICDEIIKRNIKINWTTPNGIAIWLLDEDLLMKMKKSGCYRLTFGLESGNSEVLKNFIGKNYSYEKAREIIKFASKIGLWTMGTFIIGFPYETKEQIQQTIDFSISTDLDFSVFYIANPFPGTPMYDIYLKEKLLPSGGAHEIVRGCKSKNFSHEKLIYFQQKATADFLKSRFKKPEIILRKLKELKNWLYLLKSGNNFLNIVLKSSKIKTKGINALWK